MVAQSLSAPSMAEVNSADSGSTFESKRFSTSPFFPIRYLVKFHFGSPAALPRNWYSGAASVPFTEIFEDIGNVTLYLREQNVLISASVPGSCPPKLLAGTPTSTRPCALYFSQIFSSPAYCGV